MAKIELLFGAPNLPVEEIEIEKDAYAWDVCIETAVIRRFRHWIDHLAKRNQNGDHFFELLLFVECLERIGLPKMTSGVYRHNGFVLPKLVIHGHYGVDQKTGNQLLLSEKHLNAIGNGFEQNIGFEYFEYRRCGITRNRSNAPNYLLGNEALIADSGKFYKT
jgi:hypothetical protein